jgi:hypothetical protein
MKEPHRWRASLVDPLFERTSHPSCALTSSSTMETLHLTNVDHEHTPLSKQLNDILSHLLFGTPGKASHTVCLSPTPTFRIEVMFNHPRKLNDSTIGGIHAKACKKPNLELIRIQQYVKVKDDKAVDANRIQCRDTILSSTLAASRQEKDLFARRTKVSRRSIQNRRVPPAICIRFANDRNSVKQPLQHI